LGLLTSHGHLCPVAWVEAADVVDHTGEGTSLKDAQQEAQGKEGGLVLDAGEASSNSSPGGADEGNPQRATEEVQGNVAGELEDCAAAKQEA
jgi:hypothetical protein